MWNFGKVGVKKQIMTALRLGSWTLHWHVVVVSTFPVSNPLFFPWCCLEVKYSNLKHPSIKIGRVVVEIPWKHLLFSEVWSLQLLEELRQQRLIPQLQTFSCALRAIGTYRWMGWCWGHIYIYIYVYIYIYISFYRKTMYLFNVFNYLTIVCFPIQKPPVGFWVFQNTKIPMTFAGICCCQVGAKPCIVERTLSCWQWPSGPLGEWWEKHWRKNNRRMVRWWRKTSTFASCKWNPWKKCMQLILLCKVESLIHRSSWMFWMLLVSRKPKLTKLQADEIAFGAILAVEMGSWPVSLRLLEQMEDLEMRCDNCNLCWIGSS